jgi:hypothetical protein
MSKERNMPKNFNLPTDLSAEARQAMNAVFDALAEWREEIGSSTERFSESVLDKMATAARAAGWPSELVETSRAHLLQASKLQMQTIDQLMDAWQAQLRSPFPAQFLSPVPSFAKGFDLPPGMAGLATSPLQFWMQAAETWQQNLASAFAMWTGQSTRTANGSSERASRSH